MNLRYCSKQAFQTAALPGPSAVLRMADSEAQLATTVDYRKVVMDRAMVFNDATVDCGLVRKPTLEDATAIVRYWESVQRRGPEIEYFVAQCEAGVGRSQAVIAALQHLCGEPNNEIMRLGSYNRLLYKLILQAAGKPAPPEPLVSVVVRVKYPWDRLDAFLCCMERQRYESIEVFAVTDGCYGNPNMRQVEEWYPQAYDRKVKLRYIETPTAKGYWGHPYRQLGIDAAKGDYIVMTNDDNYYVPGFIEQMVFACQEHKARMAICQTLHSYRGWSVAEPGADLGCFLAEASLVKDTPWEGDDLHADRRYIQRLADKAGGVAVVERPLFVHN